MHIKNYFQHESQTSERIIVSKKFRQQYEWKLLLQNKREPQSLLPNNNKSVSEKRGKIYAN